VGTGASLEAAGFIAHVLESFGRSEERGVCIQVFSLQWYAGTLKFSILF